MGRTFKDTLRFDAEKTFLNTNSFAESVVHWPLGDHAEAVTRKAIVDWDEQEGQMFGTTRFTSGPKGRKADRFVNIELSMSITVTESDRFVLTNQTDGSEYLANVIRRVAEDHGMQSWLCVVPNGFDSKSARVRQ